jgi:hypothetical protein
MPGRSVTGYIQQLKHFILWYRFIFIAANGAARAQKNGDCFGSKRGAGLNRGLPGKRIFCVVQGSMRAGSHTVSASDAEVRCTVFQFRSFIPVECQQSERANFNAYPVPSTFILVYLYQAHVVILIVKTDPI